MFVCVCVGRILRKLPSAAEDGKVQLMHLLVAMLRARGDEKLQKSRLYTRMLRRLVHWVAQQIEVAIEGALTETCPSPSVNAKVHPYLKASRMKGNKALQLHLVERFQARSGGYVTTKDMQLKDLGVITEQKAFGCRTASEFCARLLGKTAAFMSEYDNRSTGKVINMAVDCAAVATEQAWAWQ